MENDKNINLGSLASSTARAVNESPVVKCPKCGSMYWDETYLVKSIPGIYTGKTHDQILPIPVWVCHKCGEILPQMANLDEFKKLIEPKEQEETKPSILTA
jgi:uncharacterized protein with PIN domain